MRFLKITSFSLLYVLVAVMGLATFVERARGTAYAAAHIYGSWWFCLLWGVLAAAALAYFLRRRVRSVSLWLLHVGLITILAGALCTHLTARHGVVHLRQGIPASAYATFDAEGRSFFHPLPFSLRLDTFRVERYAGTAAPADYVSELTVGMGGTPRRVTVSMNHIFAHSSVRLYQSSYDADGLGSVLTVNADPVGIPVTYVGYALLFVGLAGLLVEPKSRFRALLRHPMLRKGALLAALAQMPAAVWAAAPTVPAAAARQAGDLLVNDGRRICPLQTLAIDFTKKLCGSTTYEGLSAEQVLLGWTFWGSEWEHEPMIRVKSRALRRHCGLKQRASFRDFFSSGRYCLQPLVEAFYAGRRDALCKAAAETDATLQLIFSLRYGHLLRLFPHTEGSNTVWLAPTDSLPPSMSATDSLFVRRVFPALMSDLRTGQIDRFERGLRAIDVYQRRHAGASRPSELSLWAERWYNCLPLTPLLFRLNLTAGVLLLVFFIWRLLRSERRPTWRGERPLWRAAWAVQLLSWALLTLCIGLRWLAGGKIPMANGYETMLLLAWCVQPVSLWLGRRLRLMLPLGFLLSGFFLLVSFIGQMDPQIAPMMPVLVSPLLSVHVSLVMMSFALLSFTFLCGVVALLLMWVGGARNPVVSRQLEVLHLLSRLFLYPALALLGAGIFVGAIWANLSWGRYWSWDPKEVWALIAFLCYAVAAHDVALKKLRKPVAYHLYMVVCFLTVLMTYFGVNYYLGGMHSYAG